MLKTFLHSKIHRVKVTSVDLNYEGSIIIDEHLLEKAEIHPHEQVQVLNLRNGERFITYSIPGPANSGLIQVNGAAAHLCKSDDLLIIISYCQIELSELSQLRCKVLHVDGDNKITNLTENNPASSHTTQTITQTH